jgi:anaerobic ribonucleoside-triphosphate reductase activating protein
MGDRDTPDSPRDGLGETAGETGDGSGLADDSDPDAEAEADGGAVPETAAADEDTDADAVAVEVSVIERADTAGSGTDGEAIHEDWLYLGFTHAPLTVLGPGIRVGVWTRGCDQGCPGCISPELQKARADDAVSARRLADWVVSAGAALKTGRLTVSGGEPFYRPKALRTFIKRSRKGGIRDILIYSGRKLEPLLEDFPWIPGRVTALVDGPFEEGKPTDSPWKGSEGQTLTVFDSDYEGDYEAWRNLRERSLQVAPFPGGVRILGIPAIGEYDNITL